MILIIEQIIKQQAEIAKQKKNLKAVNNENNKK